MSGRHAFNELTKDFTPERRARVDGRKAELRAAMPLYELRRAREMTQQEVGRALHMNQPPSLPIQTAESCLDLHGRTRTAP